MQIFLFFAFFISYIFLIACTQHKSVVAVRLYFKIIIERSYFFKLLFCFFFKYSLIKLALLTGRANNQPVPFLCKQAFRNQRPCFISFYIGMRNQLIKIFSAVFAFLLRYAFIKRGILLDKKNNMVALILVGFHSHKIRIFFIVNQISLHTQNQLDFAFCCIISLRQSLHHTVIRNGDCPVPPLNSPVYQCFGCSNTIHFRKRGMQMQFHSFFRCMIFLFRLKNRLNTVGRYHIFTRKLIFLITALDNQRFCAFNLFNDCIHNILIVKHLNGSGRSVIRNIKGKDFIKAPFGILHFKFNNISPHGNIA